MAIGSSLSWDAHVVPIASLRLSHSCRRGRVLWTRTAKRYQPELRERAVPMALEIETGNGVGMGPASTPALVGDAFRADATVPPQVRRNEHGSPRQPLPQPDRVPAGLPTRT